MKMKDIGKGRCMRYIWPLFVLLCLMATALSVSAVGGMSRIGAPVISGVADGGVYYVTQEITVSDSDLSHVTVNGTEMEVPVRLPGNVNTSYTVVATDLAGNQTAVQITMRPISSIATSLDGIEPSNVKSNHAAQITGIVESVSDWDISYATAEERQAINVILSRCDLLLTRLEEIAARMKQVKIGKSGYELDAVKSIHKNDVELLLEKAEMLLSSDNLTAAERAEYESYYDYIEELSERILFSIAELQRVEDGAALYGPIEITASDKEAINNLLDSADVLLSGGNLTNAERTRLRIAVRTLEEKLASISIFAEDIEAITSAVTMYHLDTVGSADKTVLENLLRDIDTLLLNVRLSSVERNTLDRVRPTAEALLARINSAAAAVNTPTIVGTNAVTAETVTKAGKDALLQARVDLETAFANYVGNYSEEEKAAILASVDRISKALAALSRVETMETGVAALPDAVTVKENDPVVGMAYQAIRRVYEAMTEHEKSLVSAATMTKYVAVGNALTNYHVWEGDGAVWRERGDDPLVFRISGAADKFLRLTVDGITLATTSYTVDADDKGAVITLSVEYLDTLNVGHHILMVHYVDGSAGAGFNIDKGPMPVWAWILIGLGIAGVLAAIGYKFWHMVMDDEEEVVRENT